MLNYKKLDSDLQNIKNKHVLIFKFFNLLDFFDDKIAKIIMSYIIKHCFDIFTSYPMYRLCIYIPKNRYPETVNIILSFYEIIKEKYILLEQLKKWYNIYKNKFFWNKDINEQIKDLIKLKHLIMALFDNSNGGVPFGIKILPILKLNKNNCRIVTINSAIERLHKLFTLMGSDFFKILKIKIVTVEVFLTFSDELIVQYINNVYMKTIAILSGTIDLFEKYNMINLKMENLLNPSFVNIEEDTILEDDVEDISTFF